MIMEYILYSDGSSVINENEIIIGNKIIDNNNSIKVLIIIRNSYYNFTSINNI